MIAVLKKFLRSIFLAGFCVTLSSCAEIELASHVTKSALGTTSSATVQEGNFKVGKPYKVMGQTYHPKETYDHVETGIASWYGPGFHGKKTANGETFDTGELTAAHRTLQMPSLVRVTNLENGRSVIVRVNDRGPFSRGRVIDVSQRAAELLGFKNQGTAKVKLELLREESLRVADMARRGESTKGIEVAVNQGRMPPEATSVAPPEPVQVAAYEPPRGAGVPMADGVMAEPLAPVPVHRAADGRYMPDPVVTQMPVTASNIFIQAGAFTIYENAVRLSQSLSSVGKTSIHEAVVGGQQFYRVRVGPAQTVQLADHLLTRVVAMGHDKAIIIVD